MHAVVPVFRGLALAGDVLRLPRHTILHAGPPVSLPHVARPLLNSAIMAAVYEGWAREPVEAESKLLSGEIALAPAQNHHAMVPLAAVLSPSMTVQIVVDANDERNMSVAPLNGGMVRAQRLGLRGPAVLAHLRWINGNLGATLSIISDIDIPLINIAHAALLEGDDCHGRTVAASRQLVSMLGPRLGTDTPERWFLDRCPGFFLNIWMAAMQCVANAGRGPGSSIVTAMGANGIDAGIQVGGASGRWLSAPATPPEGPVEPGFTAEDKLPAIGDSALVDAMGFGAMAAQRQTTGGTDGDSRARALSLLPVLHPCFKRSPMRVGMPARLVAAGAQPPVIALGVLDKKGQSGRIGGGLYTPPANLFAEACATL